MPVISNQFVIKTIIFFNELLISVLTKRFRKERYWLNAEKMLKKGKYKIKVLNTINFAKSMHYNPFAYARHEVA